MTPIPAARGVAARPGNGSARCRPSRGWGPAGRGALLDAQQTLQVPPEDRFLLRLREALHREDPGHGPVERHVVRPVRAEDDTIGADGVDEKAQRRPGVDDAVVVEAPQIGARRLADVRAGLRADLPAAVHAADPVAGIAPAVAEHDLEVGIL